MSKQEQHFVVVVVIVVVTARSYSWLGKRRQKCPSFPEKSRIASPIHQRRHHDFQRHCHSWNTTTTTTTTTTSTVATVTIRDKKQ